RWRPGCCRPAPGAALRRATTPSARFRCPRKRTTAAGRAQWRRWRTSLRMSWSHSELLGEEGANLGGFDIARHEGLADTAHQDEGELTALDLLVLRNEIHHRIDAGPVEAGHRPHMGRQADRRKVRDGAIGFRLRNEAAPRRKFEGERHAESD